MKKLIVVLAAVLCSQAYAMKSCDELKSEIAAKLDAQGVKGYSLEVVDKDAVGAAAKVVGTCENGKKKITYEKKK